ncbi:MAG: ABC transporter ATP-binding protein [Microthrixaceae bacterium]
MPTGPWPAVVARQLLKRFGDNVAVSSIDLDIPVGSFCGLVGPNGSGKTTTLRMVAGMQRPDAGQVWVGGHDTWADTAAVRRLLGVVPDPLNLFDRLTARELLSHLGRLRGMSRESVALRSEELLEVMDLSDSADEQVGGYSHGMRKKTAIAAALLHRPSVLLLDEPFEGVDPVSAVAVRSMLDRFRVAGGTVVFSSHAMDLVERMCDDVVVMSRGSVLAHGTLDEVRGVGARLEDAFISMIGASPTDPTKLTWLDGDPT